MVSPKQVCVIGAGVSGLAAAKAFVEHGHKVTIIEKSGNLGGPRVRRSTPISPTMRATMGSIA